MFIEPPLVGPDRIVATTIAAIRSAFPRKDNKQLVDIAIAIPIVETPVNITRRQYLEDIIHSVLRGLIIIFSAAVFLAFINLNILQVEH